MKQFCTGAPVHRSLPSRQSIDLIFRLSTAPGLPQRIGHRFDVLESIRIPGAAGARPGQIPVCPPVRPAQPSDPVAPHPGQRPGRRPGAVEYSVGEGGSALAECPHHIMAALRPNTEAAKGLYAAY